MRISKEAARQISIKMTEKKQKELDILKKEISDVGYQLAKSTIKKDVLEFYEKHKGYFNVADTLQVSGTGLNFEQIYFSPSLPKSDSSQRYIAKLVDNETAKKIITLLHKKRDLKKQLDCLRNDIEIALISLGTHAKIQSEFKEAAPFIVVKESVALAVNISDIKKRL